MTGEMGEVHSDIRCQEDIKSIVRRVAFEAGRNLHQVAALLENAFTIEKTRRQFVIMAGRAHADGNPASGDAKFDRFFARQRVRLLSRT